MVEALIQVMTAIADSAEAASATARVAEQGSPALPKRFSLTERTIAAMMRENTGASILDSGSAYGRAWERNATSAFWEKPRCEVEFDVYTPTYGKSAGVAELSPNVTIDLFHFLTEKLDYDRALTRQFAKFCAFEENARKCEFECMQEFQEWIAEKRDATLEVIGTENSYNCDNYLSGTIQFTLFRMDHEEYCILQIHGGCDVRGGYTSPKVFRCEDYGVCDYYRATLAPDFQEVKARKAALLKEINAKTWLFESERIVALDAIEDGMDVYWDIGGNDDHGEGCDKLDSYPVVEVESAEQWRKGTVCVLPDRSALCPVTGCKLIAGWY